MVTQSAISHDDGLVADRKPTPIIRDADHALTFEHCRARWRHDLDGKLWNRVVAARSLLFRERDKQRMLLAARGAPRGEEVDESDAAGEIGLGEAGFFGKPGQGEVGCRTIDQRRRQNRRIAEEAEGEIPREYGEEDERKDERQPAQSTALRRAPVRSATMQSGAPARRCASGDRSG